SPVAPLGVDARVHRDPVHVRAQRRSSIEPPVAQVGEDLRMYLLAQVLEVEPRPRSPASKRGVDPPAHDPDGRFSADQIVVDELSIVTCFHGTTIPPKGPLPDASFMRPRDVPHRLNMQ